MSENVRPQSFFISPSWPSISFAILRLWRRCHLTNYAADQSIARRKRLRKSPTLYHLCKSFSYQLGCFRRLTRHCAR